MDLASKSDYEPKIEHLLANVKLDRESKRTRFKVNFTIDKELFEKLKAFSNQTGVSMSQVVNSLLAVYLSNVKIYKEDKE